MATKAMPEHKLAKQSKLLDCRPESLRYGDKKKEVTAMLEQLRTVFAVPHRNDLRA